MQADLASELSPRALIALVGEDTWLAQQSAQPFLSLATNSAQNQSAQRKSEAKSAAFFSEIFSAQNLPADLSPWAQRSQFFSLSKSANALGQEWDLIIVDARFGLHVESLAIASGALKAGGLLLLWLRDWDNLAYQPDQDSLRWSGANQPIASPNFIQYFQQCFMQAGFACYQQIKGEIPDLRLKIEPKSAPVFSEVFALNGDQQKIAQQILNQPAQLNLITAKRGRGKSALAGWLAEKLAQRAEVWVTAPNLNALNSLRKFAQTPIPFIAPDALLKQIQTGEDFSQAWLLVDEAASIPLPILQQFSQHFRHLLLTSTTQSYEGTGQGLLLKLIKNFQKNHRTLRHFQLSTPLRWAPNDPIEAFVENLLLLENEVASADFNLAQLANLSLQPITQTVLFLSQKYHQFYALLALAHYRTTPLDLRRLFDAPAQYLYGIEQDHQQLACLWALSEGAMQDEALLEQIWLGERRPKGNLVAQSLCFQAGLKQACRLKSLRISRFALAPDLQNQGLGQTWLKAWLGNLDAEDWDYVSVSFGYQPDLAHFWQKCGFHFVHIGEHQEASSGCYSAIALYPLSKAGKDFCQLAQASFQRHIALSFHPLAENFAGTADWHVNQQDLQALQGFAYGQRSLASTVPALRRYLALYPNQACPKLNSYLQQPQIPSPQKPWLQACRQELQQLLELNIYE